MISYLPLFSILVLLIFSALTPAAFLFRRSMTQSWLVAVLGAFIGWILILLAGFDLPYNISLLSWEPPELFSASPLLLVDRISWPFALGLATLALAVIVTEVAREFEAELSSWAASLALAALGMTAVLAGNPLTLLLGWSALDFIELFILLRQLQRTEERRQVVNAFAARVAGTVLLLMGLILASASNIKLGFENVPTSVSIYLLLGASLRLGVIPVHLPFWREPPLRRGIGTISRLTTVAASLVLLPRVASAGVQQEQAAILLLLTSLAAIYSGYSWFNSTNELEGRPFWILGLAALSLAAAIRGQPLASLAWGSALIFTGGLQFLYSVRSRYLLVLPLLSVFSSASLPFTPTWYAGQIYSSPYSVWQIVFIISQALLLGGVVRHSMRSVGELSRVERWVWVIYPIGLIMILFSQYLASWLGGTLLGGAGWEIGFGTMLPGIMGLVLTGLWLLWARKIPRVPKQVVAIFDKVFSLGWFYFLLAWLFRLTGQALSFITAVLEGEGGILWALLLLVLLIAFLSQRGFSGG